MTVADKFRNFCDDIRISSNAVDNISYRYKRITKQLNNDFWNTNSDTAHSLYVGSYGRDTDIHISDVDMLMRLPANYYYSYNAYVSNGQSALLQAVRSSIEKTYGFTRLKGDGQVVVVPFTDGITFEVLPCFINVDNSYTYPDANGGGVWKTTDPVPEREAIKTANDLYNGNLKRLCRMMRVWKDEWSVLISGILIDTLAYDFIRTWQYRDKSYMYYDWMARDFFEYLKNQNANQQYWLAPGSNKYVYREGNFEYKALRCYNIAVEAVRYEVDGKSYATTQKWKEIFGSKFKG